MLSLILPARCIHCDASITHPDKGLGRYLCSGCLKMFNAAEPPNSEQVRGQLPVFASLPDTTPLFCYRTFVKDGLIQTIVHSFKYGDMPRLARIIGAIVAKELKEEFAKIDFVVAVPLHQTRISERGYNQSEEIARGIGKALGVPIFCDKVIRRVRPTRSQTTLTIPERLENVEEAFRLTRQGSKIIKGKNILLVDDVMTTGSTIVSAGAEILTASPKSLSYFVFGVAE